MRNVIRFSKRAAAWVMALLFLFPLGVSAQTDPFILNDPIQNTYAGRPNMLPLIAGLAFGDLPMNMDTRDAIVRGGAYEQLGMPKFYFLKEADVIALKGYLLSRRKELTDAHP